MMTWSLFLQSLYLQLCFTASILVPVNSFFFTPHGTPPFISSPGQISAFNRYSFGSSHKLRVDTSLSNSESDSNGDGNINGDDDTIDPCSLMDMDIVIYKIKNDPQKSYIGAIQEDMTLAPLSAWTKEPAFGNSIEFVVDEEDRWMEELNLDNVIIESLLSEDLFSYGSRQVGGGKGLGNPHGEESELVYYVESEVLEAKDIEIPIKPDLEILW